VPIGMPGPITWWQSKNRETCGRWQENHNMLLVAGLIFQSRDCIIPVQNRGNGDKSGWNICGGTIPSGLNSKDAKDKQGRPLLSHATVGGTWSNWAMKKGIAMRACDKLLIGRFFMSHDTTFLPNICWASRTKVVEASRACECQPSSVALCSPFGRYRSRLVNPGRGYQ